MVGNLERVLDLEDADVVHQNVDVTHDLDDRSDAGRGCRIAGRRDQRRVADGGADPAERRLDIGGLAAVDRDCCAARG